MAETTFGVTYDGAALRSGRMPVRDLAPALIALGDLFSLASGILHPDLEPVALNVQATQEGSFIVRLYLDAEAAWDSIMHFFASSEASALSNLKDAILTGGGLFWLIKRLNNRRIIKHEQETPQPGMVRLTLDDHTTVEVPADTLRLFRSIELRKHAREVVAPLGREGIETVTLSAGANADAVVINKGDLAAFADVEGKEEPLLDTEQEMFVEIVAVAFQSGNKWRLSLGDYTFWASIEDMNFLDRIESGLEAFRKGDFLRCKMAVRQTRDAEGLHTEYRVTEVVEHIPREPSEQLGLGDGDS